MKVIKYEDKKEYEAIQYTGNFDKVISFAGGPNNVDLIDEKLYINSKSSIIEVAEYNDYIIKDEYSRCHVCKSGSMLRYYKFIND